MIWYDPSSDFSQLDLPAPYLRLISLLQINLLAYNERRCTLQCTDTLVLSGLAAISSIDHWIHLRLPINCNFTRFYVFHLLHITRYIISGFDTKIISKSAFWNSAYCSFLPASPGSSFQQTSTVTPLLCRSTRLTSEINCNGSIRGSFKGTVGGPGWVSIWNESKLLRKTIVKSVI